MDHIRYNFKLLNGETKEEHNLSNDVRKKMLEYLEYRYKICYEDAEDVMQDAILSILEMQNKNVLREPENSHAYLYTILKRECLKVIRNNEKKCEYIDQQVDIYSTPGQLEDLHFDEHLKIIHDCISTMNEFNQRFINYIIDNPDKSADEVGDFFGIKTSNVWTRKHRLRKWMFNCIQNKYDAPPKLKRE